jgi:ABC-type uncharacterized transport system involved in gliding motility auxiliary subunit
VALMAVWAERLRIPLVILGGVALLAAVAWTLITGEFGVPPRILLVAGVLLIGIAVSIEPGEAADALKTRGARYGGNTLLAALVVVGILALVNFLSVRHSQRWDVTATGVFTLSDQTQKVLNNLPAPVHVTAFMNPDQATSAGAQSSAESVESLLRNYELRSGGKLTWEIIDPDAQPGLARQFNIRQYNTLVFQMGDKRQDVTGLNESGFTGALLKLAATSQPKVYFLTGHGERTLEGATPDSYSDVRRALLADNYLVEPLNLLTTGRVPDDAAVLVVTSPRNPLLAEEIQAINEYVDRAGHLYLLADPRSAESLQPLVERWGISLTNGFIVDLAPQLGQLNDPLAPFITRYTFHSITRDLMQDNLHLILVEATGINVGAPQPRPGVTVTKLAETSADRSYVKPLDATALEFVEGQDTRGPVAVAVAVEADAVGAPATPDAGTPGAERPKTRAVIVGDADFASNAVVLLPVAPWNRDFFLNAVNWLSGSEELASIRPRPPEQRQLFLTTAQRNLIFFSTVILMPLLALAAGLLMWWGRR